VFGRKSQDSDTVVRLIASQVRRDISVGVLAPDTKLKIEDLRTRYGGSAHSFREALTLLAAEGLVEANAQRGFRVASATQTDLEDILRLRAEIETLGLGWSIKHGDLRWEGQVVAALHTYSRLCAQAALDPAAYAIEWDEAARQFHGALVAACRSPRLIDFQDRLFAQSRRFHFAALMEGRIDLNADVAALDAVVKAVLARDADRASELLSKQILSVMTR